MARRVRARDAARCASHARARGYAVRVPGGTEVALSASQQISQTEKSEAGGR